MDLHNMTQPVIQLLHFQTEPGLHSPVFEGPKTEQFDPKYSKCRIFDLTELRVLNITGLRHRIAKIYGQELVTRALFL